MMPTGLQKRYGGDAKVPKMKNSGGTASGAKHNAMANAALRTPTTPAPSNKGMGSGKKRKGY